MLKTPERRAGSVDLRLDRGEVSDPLHDCWMGNFMGSKTCCSRANQQAVKSPWSLSLERNVRGRIAIRSRVLSNFGSLPHSSERVPFSIHQHKRTSPFVIFKPAISSQLQRPPLRPSQLLPSRVPHLRSARPLPRRQLPPHRILLPFIPQLLRHLAHPSVVAFERRRLRRCHGLTFVRR